MAEVKMTDELRNKLLGVLPLNDSLISFIPDIYDNIEMTDEERDAFLPIIQIRAWTNKEIISFKQQMTDELSQSKKKKNIVKDVKTIQIEFIKNAVVDITNLINANTQEEIKYDGINTLKGLPEVLIGAIITKLAEVSGFIPYLGK